MPKDSLLEIIIKDRTFNTLDCVLENDVEYQKTIEKQERERDKLDDIGLSEKQRKLVDRAISATNACGAAYGIAAYRQGLHDGLKLMAELKEIT